MARYDHLTIRKDAVTPAVVLEEAGGPFPLYRLPLPHAEITDNEKPTMNRATRSAPALRFLLAGLTLALGLDAAPSWGACTAGNAGGTAEVVEATPSSDFIVHGNGTVTHTKTGLMWKQCAEGLSGATCVSGEAPLMTWTDALAAAANSTFAGYDDWRLPNHKELLSIVETCGYLPAINQEIFPNTILLWAPPWDYWSASSYVNNPAFARSVEFLIGSDNIDVRTAYYYVRLVRGGQSFDAFDINLVPSPSNTPPGSNVTVQSNGATITFAGVTQAGYTTVTPIDPGQAGQLPGGFAIVGDLAFEISTTATVSGPITVCLTASSVNDPAVFASLSVLHNEGGVLVDRTILSPDSPAPNFATRTICARVNSLSPFVIARKASSFAAFTAKLEVKLGPSFNDDKFEIKAYFSLGTGSDGIAPLTEDATLQIGSFSVTIPAGSFKLKSSKSSNPEEYKFEGTINGIKLEVKIKPAGNGFEFKAEGKGANLAGIAVPETVKLTIGNDSGSATAIPELK